ncbi:MAG: hypothetical protein U0414_10735 [Polyangiaceae bacterium]
MRLRSFGTFLFFFGGACAGAIAAGACDDSTTSGSPDVLLRASAEMLPGFAYSTGLQPPGSPVQASFDLSASGTVTVEAHAIASGDEASPALNGKPGSGGVTIAGGFAMTGALKVDIDGLPSYDGPIPGIENVKIDVGAVQPFDPFSIGAPVVAHAAIPPTKLPPIPLPGGIPGSLVLEIADGSFLDAGFTGTCASIDGAHATYAGDVARSGTLVIAPTIEIEVPFLGTKSFPIPPFSVPLDLGGSSLVAEADVEAWGDPASGDPATVGKCGDTGSTTSSSSGGVGGAGSTSASGVTTGASMTTSSTGGSTCPDPGPEPNDSLATATKDHTDVSCFPITTTLKSGMLGGGDDADFYAFDNATDVCAGPTKVVVQPMNILSGTRFCVFPECATTSHPDILACEGSSTNASVSGVDGCCATDTNVQMHLECTEGSSTLTTFVVRVDQPGYEDCASYDFTLTYAE